MGQALITKYSHCLDHDGFIFFMKEIWKDIKGYEGLYQVSNYGKVKRLKTSHIKKHPITKKKTRFFYKERENKKWLRDNYYAVGLIKNKTTKIIAIHRLIAESFIPNPENKPQVNHKNGIKTDNRLKNLEWCTSKENILHAWKNNLCSSGEKHYKTNISNLDAQKILKLFKEGEKQVDIAKIFCISKHVVNKIISGKSWKYLDRR